MTQKEIKHKDIDLIQKDQRKHHENFVRSEQIENNNKTDIKAVQRERERERGHSENNIKYGNDL